LPKHSKRARLCGWLPDEPLHRLGVGCRARGVSRGKVLIRTRPGASIGSLTRCHDRGCHLDSFLVWQIASPSAEDDATRVSRVLFGPDQPTVARGVDEGEDLSDQGIVAELRTCRLQPLREHAFFAVERLERNMQALDRGFVEAAAA
jgi:hypothetical protein